MTGILFFIRRVGWFLWDNPRYLVFLLAGILLLVIGLQMRGCFTKQVKFNEKETFEANQAIETQNRKEMVEVLAQSDVREKQIDANVAKSEDAVLKAFEESRKKYSEMDNDALAKELEARK